MPRVTVIIPTYNWSTVLPYSIGSVLGQTFNDFELLVVGDGCTDDSESVVRSMNDPRVRWIAIPRSGHQSGPNNEGIRQASGELIAYLGHDDLWLPHHLEVLVSAIDAGADLVHALVALVPSPQSGKPLSVAAPKWRPPSSVMHRRDVIARIGGWRDYRDLDVTPEGDLWQRVEAGGYRIDLVPRLSTLKFPASWRRNVYVARPFDEQAAWLQRIVSEPNFEVIELAKIAVSRKPAFVDRLIRLVMCPSQWLPIIWRRRGARIHAWKRFKGVD